MGRKHWGEVRRKSVRAKMAGQLILASFCLCFLGLAVTPTSAAPGVPWVNIEQPVVGIGESLSEPLEPGSERVIPGWEFRDALARVVPDLDYYIQEIVDHIDSANITHRDGSMHVDILLTVEDLVIRVGDPKKSRKYDVYGMRFRRNVHFELTSRRDNIEVVSVRGITFFAKVPTFPDGVIPRALKLDLSTQRMWIWVQSFKGLIAVEAHVDVKERKFEGVDWTASILRNFKMAIAAIGRALRRAESAPEESDSQQQAPQG